MQHKRGNILNINSLKSFLRSKYVDNENVGNNF